MKHGRIVLPALVAVAGLLLVGACAPAVAPPGPPGAPAPAARLAGPTRVAVGVTETMEQFNPYGDSVALLYSTWSQITGPFGTFDYDKADYVGWLAQRWENPDPNTWVFHLRKDARFHDGSPLTAADVVHSINRIKTDPQSKQEASVVAPIAGTEVVDANTVKVITKKPTAPLLAFLFDRLIITSKAVYDKYGPEVADKQYPLGAGVYKFKELIPGQRFVIAKWADHPDIGKWPQAPDEVVFRVMREPEQRVTALLNDEVQIAQFLPPHLYASVDKAPNTRVVAGDSDEIMFLAMQPKPPFDNKLVRQAVAYAIDRDTIIKTILEGQAIRLDGPLGPGQYGYDANLQPKYTYNPQKAKELLAQAGYPSGLDVELETPVGRYTLDKQLTEAMIPMLNAGGFRARLLTPEWATLWANVQAGKVPFYYMGRGSVTDPSAALHQYFRTAGSPRIGYSSAKIDEALDREQAAFDPAQRKRALAEAMSAITDEAPAHFLWRHKILWGLSKKVEFKPRPDFYVRGVDIKVLQ